MDNFRQPQRPKRGFAIDGMLRQPKTQPRAQPGVGASNQPVQKQTLGNFKQPSGFTASTQPAVPGATPFQRAEQPKSKKEKKNRRAKRQDKKALKKEHRKSHKWRTLFKRVSLVLLALIVIGGGYVGAKAYMKSRKVLKGGGSAAALQANVDPSRLAGEGDGRINILLLGIGGAGHDGPDLTDTILIASIDPVHHEAALVSVPRDLWVRPAGGSYTKINAVYANAKYAVMNGKKVPNQAAAAENAGENAIKATIQDTLGIPIHYHVLVDFEAFRKAIDTVGGVDINVKTQLYDPTVAWENNWNPLIAAVGQQHMNGTKALLYVRSRHGSARGDFDRSERQREMIVALEEKVFTLGTFGNPIKVSQLIDAFGNHVQTNFSSSEVMRLYSIGKQIPGTKVSSVGLADPPNDYVTTGMANGQSIVLPKAGIGEYAAIRSYIRNTLKDSYIRDENANIMILNGTNRAGFATTEATELKSYGYNVGVVGDAPTKNYAQTQLVDLRNGKKKYTQHYLESRLGVSATTKLPAGIDPGTADFVIVLGQSSAQ